MTKYLSTTKLISLLPEIDLIEMYRDLKERQPYNRYKQDNLSILEYIHGDTETNKRCIQYVYENESKMLYIRFSHNTTDYTHRSDIHIHPYTQWLVMVKSPELDAVYPMEKSYYSSTKLRIYIDLIDYVFTKLNVTTSTMKSIIENSCINAENPNDVFNIPHNDTELGKRLGNYLYLNGLDNGMLMSRIPDIIDHIDDNNPKQLHLLNYTPSLVSRLSFTDLTELDKLLRQANHKIQNAYSYYMPQEAKDHFRNILNTVANDIQEQRNQLMETQIQHVRLSVWSHDAQLRDSITNGANVRVILPMALADTNERG